MGYPVGPVHSSWVSYPEAATLREIPGSPVCCGSTYLILTSAGKIQVENIRASIRLGSASAGSTMTGKAGSRELEQASTGHVSVMTPNVCKSLCSDSGSFLYSYPNNADVWC